MSVASHLTPDEFRAPVRPLRIAHANVHPHAADTAQARLLEELLEDEIAELQQLSRFAERKWRLRGGSPGTADAAPSELKRLDARIAEAQRLLDALQARFPHR